MVNRDQEYVEFVAAASGALRRTAYLVCGDWHRADDVVQDALCKLYRSWAKIDRDGNPLAYARRTVVNAALDSGRRPWRREVPTVDLPTDQLWDADPATGHAERDEVLAALTRLAPRQRACVVLRYYEDLSIEQTAQILGCSEGTVKSQTARGLETLRNVIDRAARLV
ncbi:SigE family RNA polymerase sigma factor [Kribbella sandramycini]|uniref:RNA polymerase sigma-70 factor (Sigma-E family) n=1 Tax=Kribbella sandramycini TaxID=60450 RepID=A0A7Y4L5U5_9ACTN|nr:SigE family RNA polymerase sigma factor [Kribbella sandramycini]MBB6565927.1 RNA polymerase sigma-70 factor (sigma-E family) [Kribbella sandramycini]NOL44933.1 SigE family RNA polymerase sigma factor [Kribbella sandramycini]